MSFLAVNTFGLSWANTCNDAAKRRLINTALEIDEEVSFGRIISYLGIIDDHGVNGVMGGRDQSDRVKERGAAVDGFKVRPVVLVYDNRIDAPDARWATDLKVERVLRALETDGKEEAVGIDLPVDDDRVVAILYVRRNRQCVREGRDIACQPIFGMNHVVHWTVDG